MLSSFPTTTRTASARSASRSAWISHKPFARAYAQAVEKLGLPIDQIAVIGDQIYTDVFGGNRAGALTCYVETLDRRFFWINVRYQLERGFIARGRRRMEARRHG